jgi:hypothetical protein
VSKIRCGRETETAGAAGRQTRGVQPVDKGVEAKPKPVTKSIDAQSPAVSDAPGEAVAIQPLGEQRPTCKEGFGGLSLTKYGGT